MAILNGFGRSLGDGIVGLQALSVALGRGAIAPAPVLFRLPGLPVVQQQLYAAARFAEIRELPWAAAAPNIAFAPALGFGRVVDLRDFAFDPDFRGVAMIDFFLSRLGVPPGSVPSNERRNSWLAPRVLTGTTQSGTVLVCPRSSMLLRDMPDHVHAAVLKSLVARGETIITQGEVPPDLADRVTRAPICQSLTDLCTLVTSVVKVISTDTAMVHIADALGRPCLAFFVTHRPEWRVRDYPLCRPVKLCADLPEGLEFARDAVDVIVAKKGWSTEYVLDTVRLWFEKPSDKFSSDCRAFAS